MKFWYETVVAIQDDFSLALTLFFKRREDDYSTGSRLDFVHLRDITGTDNQVLPKSERDFDSLSFLPRPLKKSAAVVDSVYSVTIYITLVTESLSHGIYYRLRYSLS